MTRRYRNNSQQKKSSFKAILFNKWTLLGLLFVLVISLALYAARLTNKNIDEQRQAVLAAKKNQEKKDKDAAFKIYEKNMKPRLDFSKLKKSDYPELKKEILKSLKEENYSGSVIAIKDDKLIVNSSIGYSDKEADKKLTDKSEYMLASIQKSFTAAAIMRLVEDNKLTLYTPLSQFFPQIPNSDYITIRNLLDMTSGLFLADYEKNAIEEEEVLNEILPNIYYQPLYNGWEYSTVNYTILAGIIRKVSGHSYQDFITDEIIKPLRLKNTGFYDKLLKKEDRTKSYKSTLEDPYSMPYTISETKYASEIGTGNIYTTPSDLLTYFQALIDGHILRKNNLESLMTHDLMYFNYTYASGVYNRDGYFLAHGVFMGFEPTALLTNDGSSGIIFMGNSYNIEHMNKDLITELFKKITAPEEEANTPVDPNQQVNNNVPDGQFNDNNYQATGDEQVYY
ncbi:serine hydrolase domain-containing protein [Vagococcus fessus]|uniref:Beta-lactamase-related domain-containing protein n=1 Tax=Vagococcus fessus TaxID=120370 RepID=A0A430A819_9ENTE|nr:serine hydrolase domain-containing protein [Vagococcus fessus]RSU03252.1 hypothetical protein CBF31_05925 [Vagococcus fessus]